MVKIASAIVMADKWELSGTYFESCNCEAACPCIFLSPPTTGDCTVLVGWHIMKGKFGDTKLDGLNIALAAHSPGHMAKVKWQAALYLDEKAKEAQKNALTKIFAGQAGGVPAVLGSHIGEVLGVKSVGITFEADGKRRRLSIPKVAEVEIEAVSGQGGSEIKIENHPLAVAPGEPAVLARSKRLSYHDHGLSWELSEKNGFFSQFKYTGP